MTLHRPDITPADLGHPTRDDVIASLRATVADLEAQLHTAGRTIAQIDGDNSALRAQVRWLAVPTQPAPVGWLPPRPGVAR